MPDNPHPRRITDEEYDRRFYKQPAYPEQPTGGRLLAIAILVAVAIAAIAWRLSQ